MSIRPNNLPPIQDMPPPGGFPKLHWREGVGHLPARGPKGWQIWLGTVAIIGYGFMKLGEGNREKAMQKLEERRIRYTLGPFLQAESDMEFKIRQEIIDKKEAEIMKDVPGWVVGESVYHSGRWMPQANYDFKTDI